MARTSFNKRELEKKKQHKREEKNKRKEERKLAGGSGSFEDMIAYVDENGVITSTPPDPFNKKEVIAENISVSTPKQEDIVIPVYIGIVEHFNTEKGYGFIRETGGAGEKFFFHVSDTNGNIEERSTVSFELERGLKGMVAVRITIVK